MLERLRNQLGTAGLLVAVVALIAALGGGALAATSPSDGKATKATASAKKSKGKRGPRGPAGPAGPTGPAGPQGPAGANGKDGTNGTNGADGAVGARGATGPTGKNGTNGVEGATGPTGPTGTFGGTVLPAGVTETGYWAFTAPGTKTIEEGDGDMVTIGTSEIVAQISFPDRIEELQLFATRYQATDPEFSTTCGKGEGGAGGTAALPKAPPHTLCVWQFGTVGGGTGFENATFTSFCSTSLCEIPAMGKTGAYLKFTTIEEGPAHGAGSWALTG